MAEAPSALILGGCGFVGRNLVQHLVEKKLCSKIKVVDRTMPAMAFLSDVHKAGCNHFDTAEVYQQFKEVLPGTQQYNEALRRLAAERYAGVAGLLDLDRLLRDGTLDPPGWDWLACERRWYCRYNGPTETHASDVHAAAPEPTHYFARADEPKIGQRIAVALGRLGVDFPRRYDVIAASSRAIAAGCIETPKSDHDLVWADLSMRAS